MENDFTPHGATQTTLGEFGPDGAVMTKTVAYTAGRNLISSIAYANAGTQTVVECGYDSLGRRFEKKVSVAGTLVLHERYAYRGFLQIAAFDVAGTQEPTLKRVIYWDPTEETATRPLAVNILGDNVYFPTVDLTKNVCELVDFYGNAAATYDYAPFGNVSAASPAGTTVPANPLQWSSEIYDSELDLVYYNYRHYSPSLGRFLSRDPIEEQGGVNLYAFVENQILFQVDMLGFKGRSGRPKQRPVFPGGVGAPINPLLPKSPPFIDEIDGGFYEEKNRLAIMLILRELILNGEKICEAGVREKPAYKERKCKPSNSKGCCVMTLQLIREFPARTNWWGKYIPGSGEVVSIVSINFSYLPYDCGFVQFIFERKEPVETFFEKYSL